MLKRTLLIFAILLLLGSIPLQFPNLWSAVTNGPLLQVPYFTLALESLLDIATVLFLFLALLSIGNITSKRLFKQLLPSAIEELLISISIGYIIVTLLTFILALGGFLNHLLVLLLIALTVLWYKHWLRILRESIKEIHDYFQSERSYFGSLFFFVLIVLLLFSSSIHLIANLYPTTETDAINYHLFPAKVYAETQSWRSLPDNPNFWPESMEMLSSVAILIKDHVAARLIHFTFVPLLFLLLMAFQKRLEFPPHASLLMNIFLAIPIVSWVAGDSTTNDLTVSFFIFLSLLLLWLWKQKEESSILILSAIVLGAALGTKHSALFVLPFFFAAILFIKGKDERKFFKTNLFALILFFGAALVVAAPWYLKSYFQTGNPIWPAFSSYLSGIYNEYGAQLSEATKRSFGIWNFSEAYKIPYQMCFGDGAKLDGTLGPFLVIFLPAVMIAWRKSQFNRFILSFLLLTLIIWLLIVQEVRYLIFLILPFLFVALPVVLDRLKETSHRLERLLQWSFLSLLTVLLMLSLPIFYRIQNDPQRYTPLLQRRFLERMMVTDEVKPFSISLARKDDFYLSRMLPTYRAVEYANRYLPDSSKVIFLGSEAPYLYLNRELVWDQRSLSLRDLAGSQTADQWFEILKRENVSHILFRRTSFPNRWFSDLESLWLFNHFQFLYSGNDYYLLKLRDRPARQPVTPLLSVLLQHPDLVRKHEGGEGFVLQNFQANFLGETRNSLVLTGKTNAEWDVMIPDSAVLLFGVAKLSPGLGDGGTIKIIVKRQHGDTVLVSERITPKEKKQNRTWKDYAIDLSVFSQEKITIRFETSLGEKGDADGDWFAFSEPMLVRSVKQLLE